MGIDIVFLNNKQRSMMADADRKALGKVAEMTEEATARTIYRLEGKIEDQICGYLAIRGVNHIVRQRRDKRTRTKIGTPDLIFAYVGIPCAWEIKTDDGDPSKEQIKVMRAMELDGWSTAIVRDVATAKTILDAMEKRKCHANPASSVEK